MRLLLFFFFCIGLRSVLFASDVVQSPDTNKGMDTLEIAKEWFNKGKKLDDEGKTAEGNAAIGEALKFATSIKNYPLMAKSMNFLAINLSAEGKRDEGISLSFRAFENFMLAGDTVRAANVKINIGMDYNNQGKYEEALKVELEALDLRLLCGDSTNLAAYYQRIGEVYKDLGIREKWKSTLETARILSRNPKYASFKTQIGILNDFGGICEAENRYDEAISVYLEMYTKSKKENYLNGMATALTNLSPVYRNTGNNDKALACAKESLEIQTKCDNQYGKLTVLNQLGEIYIAMGQQNMAHHYFLLGLRLSVEMDYLTDKKESLKGLYRVARQNGNWKEALVFHEKWSQLEDSMQNIDLQKKLTELETKYQIGKKEQQIELLNSENKLKNVRIRYQKLTMWGGGLLFLLLSALGFYGVQQRRKQHIIKQNELEQKLLRSQMNPHFIFNSLGAIQLFMMKNDGRKAAFYLASFSSLMRSILKNSREELITLEEEKQTIENYLHLHQLRLGEKLSFSVNVSDELDAGSTWLPPMLVQPFIENSILHGIEKMDENGRITISFDKVAGELWITVEDNGKGMGSYSQEKNGKHISYALQIFRERIANLKKSSFVKIDYSIESKANSGVKNPGTMVTVKLRTTLSA